jgi:hypothetical protein
MAPARGAGGSILLLIPPAICLVAVGIDYLRLEILLLGLALLAVWIGRNKLGWTARPPQCCAPLRRWSRNPFLACAIPAASSIALRLALLPWIPEPHPVVPDEFSHIFLAKTFLAGRLANPAHPLWPFFESIHILSQPTYSSMYMAGEALFLAAGKILTGHLFGGVILSTALFCAALTWFLRACVPPGWALYGGLLAAVRIGAASYWDNSYWGGSVGALGGALALGAYLRLVKRWTAASAFWFSVGVVLLANTRPYEGAGLSAVLGIALARNFLRKSGRGRWAAFAVAMTVFAVAGWAMTRHFKAVTGSAFTLPYQVNQKVYGWPMTLPWSPIRKIEYAHPEFELYRQYELEEHQYLTVPSKMATGVLLKYAYWWRFFFGVGLSATFLFTGRILRSPRLRVIWIAAGVVALMVLTEQSGYPHYIAPVAPAMLLFAVMGLRYLAQSRSVLGIAAVRVIVPLWLVLLGVRATALTPGAGRNLYSWCCGDTWPWDREPLLQKIAALPGKHLVIVTYDLSSYDTFEWVYNEPDIDAAQVIFARDMGPQKNRELLQYYPDRRVWRVLVRNNGASLKPIE